MTDATIHLDKAADHLDSAASEAGEAVKQESKTVTAKAEELSKAAAERAAAARDWRNRPMSRVIGPWTNRTCCAIMCSPSPLSPLASPPLRRSPPGLSWACCCRRAADGRRKARRPISIAAEPFS